MVNLLKTLHPKIIATNWVDASSHYFFCICIDADKLTLIYWISFLVNVFENCMIMLSVALHLFAINNIFCSEVWCGYCSSIYIHYYGRLIKSKETKRHDE